MAAGLQKLTKSYSGTTLSKSMTLLSEGDKLKVYAVALIQTFLGFLDLAAIAIFGILGALTISGIESNQPGSKVQSVLIILHIENLSFQNQASVLGLGAIILLVSKTILSMYLTKKTLYFLSFRSAKLSGETIAKLLSAPLLQIQTRASQEIVYSVTTGISSLTLGVIGAFVLLISDTSLLLVLSIALFAFDPLLALMTVALFSLMAVLVYTHLNKRAEQLGTDNSRLAIRGNMLIIELLNTFREQSVRNRKYFYSETIRINREEFSNVAAGTSFLPYIGKYVLETTVIVGCVVISAFQFYLYDAYQAVTTLSIFVAAGMRIAPAVLRIQQGAIQIRVDSASAENTRKLLEELQEFEAISSPQADNDFLHEGFDASVSLENLQFTYPKSEERAISGMNLEINPGQVVAIVGPSGAGKSTLVDLILGVIEPDTGIIKISGLPPQNVLAKFPGACAYVPQDVFISDSTIAQNIAIGFEESTFNLERINKAIDIAKLRSVIDSLPGGVDSSVGERGNRLSGGQRQRLGIARSLYTNPKLLVLDEATSALDGQTESDISDSISAMRGEVTVILIAHRLSTVRKADKVVYIEKGKIHAIGTFEEVRSQVKDFDAQAALMGL